jgi:hypothetical protein
MRFLTNLKDTGATDALIERLPIGARHSTKSRVISRGFVWSERALRSTDFPMPIQRLYLISPLTQFR